MKVEIVTAVSLSALGSPLRVHPWRRTFLSRRRRHRGSSTKSRRKFRGLVATRKTVLDRKLTQVLPSETNNTRGVDGKGTASEKIPSLIEDSRPVSSLESIVQDAALFHQKRRHRRLRALQEKSKKEENRKRSRFMATSPCERPSATCTPSKQKVMQLTGLPSISPISRPSKKQRFF